MLLHYQSNRPDLLLAYRKIYGFTSLAEVNIEMQKIISGKLGLVEQVLDQPSVRKAKKCRLTKFGVYSVIESRSKLTPSLFRNLLMYYGDHPVFQFFVYTLLNQDTLLRLRDDRGTFLSLMASYLSDCCEEVKNTNLYMDMDRHPNRPDAPSTKFKVYKAFKEDHVRLVQRLISSTLLDYSITSDILKALGQDNKFREAVEDTKIKFDKSYNLLGTFEGGLQ
jgi:hypothetical protein